MSSEVEYAVMDDGSWCEMDTWEQADSTWGIWKHKGDWRYFGMYHNPLDDIVRCNVDISSPASNDATFDNILMVVPAPAATGGSAITGTTAVSTADELLDYGFTTNDTAYQAAEVAFSQNPAPDTLYFCVRERSNNVYENLKVTLARANSEAPFYGIHLTDFRTATDLKDAIGWANANEKILGFEYTDIDACPLENSYASAQYRAFGIFSGKADGYAANAQPRDNEFAALAWMAKCFGYDPGSESWHMKTLNAIVPSALASGDKQTLEAAHLSSFRRYAGSNIAFGGWTLSGEWIDVIRFRDWLVNEIQLRVFNVLKAGAKVPYTDAGINLVRGAMKAALATGQMKGGVSPTQYDEEGNAIPGYTVRLPRAAELTQTQRKSRVLPDCKFTARLAGALHAVEISGYLTY